MLFEILKLLLEAGLAPGFHLLDMADGVVESSGEVLLVDAVLDFGEMLILVSGQL